MPRKRQIMRNPNNYGTIKKLSGNRRRPWMVGVNPKINDKGTYTYEILGYYEDRTEAMIALAEYNKNPVDLSRKDLTFAEIYEMYFNDKFVTSKKKLSESSKYAARTAYNHCKPLYKKVFADLRHRDLQNLIDSIPLKRASIENVVLHIKGMYAFAMREDVVQKNHAEFLQISNPDDEEHGVRFSADDIEKLWNNAAIPFVRIILIYIYTGWRAKEFSTMPKENVDIENMIMTGGSKTDAGKDRIIPIHPRIQQFVKELYDAPGEYMMPSIRKKGGCISYDKLRKLFMDTIKEIGITTEYTLHDCRHTFSSMLDDAGTNPVIRNLLMGHSGKDLDEKVYIHKTVEQLREAIEKLP
ncbi:MAG: tyrosine-type recombinase/integrase [Lachnospiraceae bacterium]|nr:tyrosine-type recombinase/integrase [Lachnospiraceae bacterium]